MRIVLILLLLANIALFALTRFDSQAGEPQRIAEQLQPEKIKLLSPQQVAALRSAKTASPGEVCVEWGPFSESERARVTAELAPLSIGAQMSTRRVDRAVIAQTILVFRDLPPPALARIRELVPSYAGTEIRVGGCERTG